MNMTLQCSTYMANFVYVRTAARRNGPGADCVLSSASLPGRTHCTMQCTHQVSLLLVLVLCFRFLLDNVHRAYVMFSFRDLLDDRPHIMYTCTLCRQVDGRWTDRPTLLDAVAGRRWVHDGVKGAMYMYCRMGEWMDGNRWVRVMLCSSNRLSGYR